ncbi:MAG: rhamnulokinase family protein [Verrucomicrobiota bacterium]
MDYIAFDLGAGSGRVIKGSLQDQRLTLEEVHRFSDPSITLHGSNHWQILQIFGELEEGLKCVLREGIKPRSISCDSWGVDYVLIRENNPMLCPPYQYRDSRTDGWIDKIDRELGLSSVYTETGIQTMFFNTIFQLAAHNDQDPETLRFADSFLCIADYINYLFSGVAKQEVSLASTTALYNPKHRKWSGKLIDSLGLPNIFPNIVSSGTRLGPIKTPHLKGLEETQVVATCSHDTAAAIAAVPAEDDGTSWAYLSSGTWSLMGVELDRPLINEETAKANFTNEVGYGHTIRFLKNISGLFVIQELKTEWSEQGTHYDYETMTHMAENAPAFSYFIDPNHELFSKSGDMETKIRRFCEETGQTPPSDHATVLRGVFESLALYYKKALTELEQLIGKRIDRLHIVGGGCKNMLLNQFSANSLNIEVHAGPVEATAIGNLLIQAISDGQIETLSGLRRVVRNSFETEIFTPQNPDAWESTYQSFIKVCN